MIARIKLLVVRNMAFSITKLVPKKFEYLAHRSLWFHWRIAYIPLPWQHLQLQSWHALHPYALHSHWSVAVCCLFSQLIQALPLSLHIHMQFAAIIGIMHFRSYNHYYQTTKICDLVRIILKTKQVTLGEGRANRM